MKILTFLKELKCLVFGVLLDSCYGPHPCDLIFTILCVSLLDVCLSQLKPIGSIEVITTLYFLPACNPTAPRSTCYSLLVLTSHILPRTLQVHPWVMQTCNTRSSADLIRGCQVPDTPPWSLPDGANMSMVAGDFLEVYRDQFTCWEAVNHSGSHTAPSGPQHPQWDQLTARS